MRAAWCYVKPGPATRWRCQVPETLDSDGENETNVVAHTYTHTHTLTQRKTSSETFLWLLNGVWMSLPSQVQDWINFECRICNYSDFFSRSCGNSAG